jgi:hypothetical protein
MLFLFQNVLFFTSQKFYLKKLSFATQWRKCQFFSSSKFNTFRCSLMWNKRVRSRYFIFLRPSDLISSLSVLRKCHFSKHKLLLTSFGKNATAHFIVKCQLVTITVNTEKNRRKLNIMFSSTNEVNEFLWYVPVFSFATWDFHMKNKS